MVAQVLHEFKTAQFYDFQIFKSKRDLTGCRFVVYMANRLTNLGMHSSMSLMIIAYVPIESELEVCNY